MLEKVNITDDSLKGDVSFNEFMKNNPGYSTLKIRVSAANEAFPITDVSIVVSRVIGNHEVIFYTGMTDSSGMINNIILPAPKANKDELEVPEFTTYNVLATNSNYNYSNTFDVSVCCGITVIQYINIIPPAMETNYE